MPICQRNVFLVGSAGSGKTSIVEALEKKFGTHFYFIDKSTTDSSPEPYCFMLCFKYENYDFNLILHYYHNINDLPKENIMQQSSILMLINNTCHFAEFYEDCHKLMKSRKMDHIMILETMCDPHNPYKGLTSEQREILKQLKNNEPVLQLSTKYSDQNLSQILQSIIGSIPS